MREEKNKDFGQKVGKYKVYLQFKQRLLNMMSVLDPLGIIQSQIFEDYERLAFDEIVQKQSKNNQSYMKMETKISKYYVDDTTIKVVQRRSHSEQKHVANNSIIFSETVRKLSNRLNLQQQQSNINLMIWSNIMNNHFKTKTQRKNKQNAGKQNDINFANQCQNSLSIGSQKQTVCKQTNNIKQQYNAQNIRKQLQQLLIIPQSMIGKKIQAYLQKPNMKQFKQIIIKMHEYFIEQNQKIMKQLSKLRKQNERLIKKNQQDSAKQLQYLVNLKQLQKVIDEKDRDTRFIQSKIRQKQQLSRDRQAELKMIFVNKLRQLEGKGSSYGKNSIEELKQKMAIDSLRRITLSTLNKQKFQFQLLKSDELDLNIHQGSIYNYEQYHQTSQQATQSTECGQ